MIRFDIFYDMGEGFGREADTSFVLDQVNNQEWNLPEGTTNVRLVCQAKDIILNIAEVKACSKTQNDEDLWYDLSFTSDGYRLGHNLFLLSKSGAYIEGSDFRFHTSKLKLSMESISLSPESCEKLKHSTERLISDNQTLDQKWKYQIQVYDEKVQEVVSLEKDKVELNETIQQLREQVEFWKTNYEALENSSSWKMTAPVRSINASLNDLKKGFPLRNAKKALAERAKEVGIEQARKELYLNHSLTEIQYMAVGRKNLDEERRDAETLAKAFPLSFSVFSIIRNLDEESIYHFVSLVMNQTWENYELVILDQNDKDHRTQSKILNWLSKLDSRIKLVRADLNQGPAQVWAEACEGDYLLWVNAQDQLHVSALYELAKHISEREKAEFVYTDSDFFTGDIKDARSPWYKPDWSPDFMNGQNYIRNLWAAKKELVQSCQNAGQLISQIAADTSLNPYDAAWADILQADGKYGLILSLLDQIRDDHESSEYDLSDKILHVPEKMYFEKIQNLTGTEQEIQVETALSALKEHLERVKGEDDYGRQVEEIEILDKKDCLFHVYYELPVDDELKKAPLVSIMIPNKDHIADLKRVIESVRRLTTYPEYEILVVENNSSQKETFDYYEELEREGKARVLQYTEPFNYASINNTGLKELRGEYVLLLNNDVEIITPNWIEEMMMYACRKDVGAVGAKLYYMDDTIQHAGVIIGLGGVAAHSHKDYARDAAGYMNRLRVVQNLSAVTAACILMRKEVYEEIGGMDEGYQVAFNDADFCVRIRHHGYKVVFTPFAELYHDESKSRGVEDTPEKAERFEGEVQRFKKEWPELLQHGDPYYNPNLTTAKEDFDIKEELKR